MIERFQKSSCSVSPRPPLYDWSSVTSPTCARSTQDGSPGRKAFFTRGGVLDVEDDGARRGGAGREQGQAEHDRRAEPRASRAEHGDEPSSADRRGDRRGGVARACPSFPVSQ